MRTLAACLLALAGASQAAVIAEVAQGDLRLELHDEAGPCLGHARLAVFYQGLVRVPGCWTLRGAQVLIVFLDGDMAEVDVQLFRRPKLL